MSPVRASKIYNSKADEGQSKTTKLEHSVIRKKGFFGNQSAKAISYVGQSREKSKHWKHKHVLYDYEQHGGSLGSYRPFELTQELDTLF